jgi:hypothetical protein
MARRRISVMNVTRKNGNNGRSQKNEGQANIDFEAKELKVRIKFRVVIVTVILIALIKLLHL